MPEVLDEGISTGIDVFCCHLLYLLCISLFLLFPWKSFMLHVVSSHCSCFCQCCAANIFNGILMLCNLISASLYIHIPSKREYVYIVSFLFLFFFHYSKSKIGHKHITKRCLELSSSQNLGLGRFRVYRTFLFKFCLFFHENIMFCDSILLFNGE